MVVVLIAFIVTIVLATVKVIGVWAGSWWAIVAVVPAAFLLDWLLEQLLA